MKHTSYWVVKVYSRLSASFLKNTEASRGLQKNDDQSRFFLVEGWSIEGCLTKVVERIVMHVG